jgi:hypothetical protein
MTTVVSIAPLNADKAEGSGLLSPNPFFFVITRSGGDLNVATTVNWTAGPGADPSADGADFVVFNGFSFPFYTGSVTFNAGETSKTISAGVIGDTVFEPDENFVVTLSNPSSGASIDPSHASAIGVIRNDDFLLTPSAALVAESAGTATFTLTRGANAPQQTVYLRTTETEGWTNNNDYTPLVAQPLTFATGETSKTISVAITHDAVAEPDETFRLFVMSNSTDVPSQFGLNGAFINPGLANATFTIRDEGGADYTITPNVATVNENAGTLTFTITRPSATLAETIYASTTENHGSTNNNDYNYWYNVPVAFAIGENSREVTIHVNDDSIIEGDETFGLILQRTPDPNVNNFFASSTFTIQNDDHYSAAPSTRLAHTELNAQDVKNVWMSALNEAVHWTTQNSATKTITYYLASSENFGPDDSLSASELRPAEQSAIYRAMEAYENVLNVDFVPVSSISDASLIWAIEVSPNTTDRGATIALLDDEYAPSIAAANHFAILINRSHFQVESGNSSLTPGGYDYRTFIHELGHALGLDHPHPDDLDGNGTIDNAPSFPGVVPASGDLNQDGRSNDYTFGVPSMNQGIFTVMSYNRGWLDRNNDGLTDSGAVALNPDYGIEGTPMALDIALLQHLYGANGQYHGGIDTYYLNDASNTGGDV